MTAGVFAEELVRTLAVSLVLLGIVGTHTARAEPAKPASDPEQISRLVAQLGSPQFADREKANEALIDLGRPALPALQRARQGTDPEVRRRAEAIVQRIERRIDTAEVLQPSRLRLTFNNAPLDEAVETLADKCGLQIALDVPERRKEKVILDTGGLTFWQAYERFVDCVGLGERVRLARVERSRANDDRRAIIMSDVYNVPASAEPRRTLIPRRGDPPPTFLEGALRLKALPAGSAGERREDDLAFVLDVAVEPRLQWQSVLGVKITHAVDDHGQVRVQPAAFVAGANAAAGAEDFLIVAESESGAPLEQLRTVPVRLSRGKQPAQYLKEVRGILTAMVRSAAEELVTVDLPPKKLNESLKGRKGQDIVVKSFEENGDTLRMFVQVGWAQPEVSPVVLGRAVRVNRGFRRGQAAPVAEEGEPTPALLDKNDKRPQTAVSFLIGRESRGDRIIATYLLTFQREEGVHEPVKLQVTGRRNVLIEVPFVFKDVPVSE